MENQQNQFPSREFDQTNLEWQTWRGSLPNGAVSIYNDYEKRTDYVCKYGREAGFYCPTLDPYCHYAYGEKEYRVSSFEILVNKDNLEILEWKNGSYGSVPENSVKTSATVDMYVGKNKYGLGKVHTGHKAFFLPCGGKEYWYKYYQVLTFNNDIKSEHLTDVKYQTDGVKILKYPPVSMDKSSITNRGCKPVKGTATLSKTSQAAHKWDTSFSIAMGVKTTITAENPLIGSAGIEVNAAATMQFTMGTTHTKSTTHSVSVEYTVPPNHSCVVTMVGYKYGADIPYTARLSRTYSNRQTTWTSISGMYKGVQIGEVQAVVDRCEPLPDPKPCS